MNQGRWNGMRSAAWWYARRQALHGLGQWIVEALRFLPERLYAVFRLIQGQELWTGWQQEIRKGWKTQAIPWRTGGLRVPGHFTQRISTTVWMMAQRMTLSLRVSKEEEIRAWWRAHQAEKSAYWARRGSTDARLGLQGYPHHGDCGCACCQAYWSGHTRYGKWEQPPGLRTGHLGLLDPPPRGYLFLELTQNSPSPLLHERWPPRTTPSPSAGVHPACQDSHNHPQQPRESSAASAQQRVPATNARFLDVGPRAAPYAKL